MHWNQFNCDICCYKCIKLCFELQWSTPIWSLFTMLCTILWLMSIWWHYYPELKLVSVHHVVYYTLAEEYLVALLSRIKVGLTMLCTILWLMSIWWHYYPELKLVSVHHVVYYTLADEYLVALLSRIKVGLCSPCCVLYSGWWVFGGTTIQN